MDRCLLIVEDDPDELDILTCRFIQAGYQVVSVHHPRQALEAASFRQFQVALLDASLPEMDGVELLQCLKRTQQHLRFIILAGHQCSEPWAHVEGTFAWLVKPCNMALLETTVEDAFELAVDELLV